MRGSKVNGHRVTKASFRDFGNQFGLHVGPERLWSRMSSNGANLACVGVALRGACEKSAQRSYSVQWCKYILSGVVRKLHLFRLQLGPPPRRSHESVTKSDKRRGGAACWTSRLHIPTRGIHPSFLPLPSLQRSRPGALCCNSRVEGEIRFLGSSSSSTSPSSSKLSISDGLLLLLPT
jgi:hypothetical protein